MLARGRWLVIGGLSGFLLFASLSAPALGAAQAVPEEKDSVTLARLADMLESPAQRRKVIAQLRAIAAAGTGQNVGGNSPPSSAAGSDHNAMQAMNTSIYGAFSQIARLPQALAEKTAAIATRIGDKIRKSLVSVAAAVNGTDSRLRTVDRRSFWRACRDFLLIVVAALSVFEGLRFLLRPTKRRLDLYARQGKSAATRVAHKLIAIACVSLAETALVGVTYLASNAVAFYGIGDGASLPLYAALFINAFVLLELLKIGVRVVFSPHYTGLRLLASDTAFIRYGYHWLVTIIHLLGYGYLVLVPLIDSELGEDFTELASTFLASAAFVYALWGVLAHRRDGRTVLERSSKHAHTAAGRLLLAFFAFTWHWFALVYFLLLLVGALLGSEKFLLFLVWAALQTFLTIAIAVLLSALLTRLIERRLSLPEGWRRNFPGIEKRLDAYLPPLIEGIRFVLPIAVLFSLLCLWQVIDLPKWLSSEGGGVFFEKGMSVFWILFVHALIWLVAAGFIENWLSPRSGDNIRLSARAETLLSLAKNALAIVLIGTCVMMTLARIGINIGPLIAGAGVLGLALGFGAQTLVKDVITGIFIQLENAMNSGDWVSVCGISGTAERISLRSVGLRDLEGTYHIIPFSSVTTVSNYMRGFAYHKGVYGIGYNEDIDAACAQLKAAFDELVQGDLRRHILEPIDISGVTRLGDSSVDIRVLIKTTPGDQWTVGRAYNRLVKIYFDRAGIEIPYPHQTVYFGENKGQPTPPVKVTMVGEASAPLPENGQRKGRSKASTDTAHAGKANERNEDGSPES